MCGTPFEVTSSLSERKVNCSRECYVKYILTEVHPQMPRHSTKPELEFKEFAGDLVKHTSDGKFFVNLPNGRIKNPDFVVLPFRERKVVEVFGSYWHPPEEEAELVAAFAEAGYKCLVIWDHELADDSFKDKFYTFLSC